MKEQYSIGLSHLTYKLPRLSKNIEELEATSKIKSPAQLLRDFGFDRCYISQSMEEFEQLLIGCGKAVLDKSNLSPSDIGLLLYYRAITPIAKWEGELTAFRYQLSKIQNALNLNSAKAITTAEQGCNGTLTTIELAYDYLSASNCKAVLCLSGSMLDPVSSREIMYNLMSDGACAFLLQKESPHNQIRSFHQLAEPSYWDTPEREQELIAAYFPMAARAMKEALVQAELKMDDIRWVVPHNVSVRSWLILSKLVGIPESKLWLKNVRNYGHTISCDHIINLHDMESAGQLKKGDLLLLSTFGFGASWSSMVLEY